MSRKQFCRFSAAVLAVTIGVILWGAYVRATKSGAGCGSHWPLCNGQIIPRNPTVATIIEATHRATSGIAFLLVAAQLGLAWRVFPARHLVRRSAVAAMALMVTEAAIGAGIVVFEYVANDASIARGAWTIAHLGNTFALVAALTAVWWAAGARRIEANGEPLAVGPAGFAGGPAGFAAGPAGFAGGPAGFAGGPAGFAGGPAGFAGGPAGFAGEPAGFATGPALLAAGLAGVLVVGCSGAIAALGDTLFPVSSLAEGLRADLSPAAHLFVRLRVLHPVFAVAVAVYLLVVSGVLASRGFRARATTLAALVMVQVAAGFLNLALLAPIWLQLVHLLLADAVWISLCLLALDAAAAAPVTRRPSPASLA